MIRKIKTWRALSLEDRRIVRHAMRLLSMVRIRLVLSGFGRTQAWLQKRITPVRMGAPIEEARVRQIARMVRVAQRYNRFWSNCLSYSLVLWALLRENGVSARVCAGTRVHDGKFEAHAWVEWNGVPLNNPGDDRGDFTPFERPLDIGHG